MAQFYEKEFVRIEFIHKRYETHKQQRLAMEKEAKEQKERSEEKMDEIGCTNEEQNQREIDEEIENKYQSMLVAFKKQLGIKDQ